MLDPVSQSILDRCYVIRIIEDADKNLWVQVANLPPHRITQEQADKLHEDFKEFAVAK